MTKRKDPEVLRKGDIIGNYRILELIAEGGCGQTFKAQHVVNGMLACVKDCTGVKPELSDILINESKAAWDLRHFAFPAMRDLIRKDDGTLALVMSYIPGKTVAQIVEKRGAFHPEHVAWITERVLNGLMYAHYHGIIHGDVKPHNLIVQPEKHTVVLVDFGLSQIRPKIDAESIGYTPRFASPEEEAGGNLLPESDLYSLGMTMIYMLGGGDDAVTEGEVPASTPEAIRAFIERLIVEDPLDRPHWQKENLFETFQKVRLAAFGRAESGMLRLAVD